MKSVFVDTLYFVAILSPRDQWAESARLAENDLGTVELVTTESVLLEVLNFFADRHLGMRSMAARLVRRILDTGEMTVTPYSSSNFRSGLSLYESRLDKGYSLTDCISMNAMRELGITEVLTHDRHFAQEGFTVLM
jgi:predicted nucleic acid-binding protein